jgi:phosphoribosylanthranilate isomerase
MKPVIKVCGIQNSGEALGSVSAGANTIGMLVGLTHMAEDGITPDEAKKIVSALPSDIRAVMVTHLKDPGEIARLAEFTGAKTVQLHGDIEIPEMKKLRSLVPGVTLIKAVHVTGEESVAQAAEYAEHADMLVLDSRTKDRLGGTGKTHDWSISRRIVSAVKIPVILAGGLTPENVAEAIETVRPAGIDANSGLEHPDGSKDFGKVREFAAAGRSLNPNFNQT